MAEDLEVEDGVPEDDAAEELPDGTIPSEDARAEALPILLDRHARQAFLGRLAEFELKLLALPEKMQAFCLAYIADPSNATAAARKATYHHPVVRGCQVLARGDAQAVISLGLQLREDRTMLTSDRTLNELAIIAFSNIGDYVVHPETQEVQTRQGVPEYALRAVASAEFSSTVVEGDDRTVTTYKTKIKLWPKTEALRLLAMYQRLLTDGAPVSVTVNDNRGQVHNHQHNTWEIGGKKITF